jgi:hypothetical protein
LALLISDHVLEKLLAWVTGQIDGDLRQKMEFVLKENHVDRALLDRHSPHWHLQDVERKVLAEKVKPHGKSLSEVIITVQPETVYKTVYKKGWIPGE